MKLSILIVALSFPVCISAQVLNPEKPDSLPVKSIIALRGENPPNLKSFIIPAVLISYGAVSLMGNNPVRRLDYTTKSELQEDHPLFAHHVDNFLQYAPMAAVYGLNLAGVRGKHGVADQTALYVLSFSIMGGSTAIVKRLASRPRPDGSNLYSFPSGHTASAFAAAEFLNQEYRDVSPWIGYAGYTVATATGALRMYNNKHWLSDVVAGAGFGIASAKLAYIIYPHLKQLVIGKQSIHYSMMPSYQQKTAGFSFNGTF